MNFGDIVIDTCVFLDYFNDGKCCFESSKKFLDLFMKSSCLLCVDKQSITEEMIKAIISKSHNSDHPRSIMREYLKHFKSNPMIMNWLIKLLKSKRIAGISRNVPSSKNHLISSIINKAKPVDRILLKVGYNSKNKTVVSHDFDDFSIKIRKFSGKKKKLGVKIFCSNQIVDGTKCPNCMEK